MTAQIEPNTKNEPNFRPNSMPNFLTWHYTYSLPEFTKNRLTQLSQTPKFFNVSNLLKNLFTPYRRMAVAGKTNQFGTSTLFDKLTFNLTSVFVGLSVRLILIFSSLLALIVLFIFDLIAILIWCIFPILSFPNYLNIQKNTFFQFDLDSPISFLKKLQMNKFFIILSRFFDEEFLKVISSTNAPTTFGAKTDQSIAQIILTISQNFPQLKTYLEKNSIRQNDFELLINYLEKQLLTPRKTSLTPLGQSLAYGYTNTLDRFAHEVKSTRLSSKEKHSLLVEIEKILNRPNNNNVLLTGEAGVGRHNTIEELSAAIARQQLPDLESKRVMFLDTIALASSGKNLIESKQAFEAVFAEAKNAGNIILVIDSIDKIASSTTGRFDLTDVLRTILTDNSLPIIGITTPDDFNKFIRPNSNFSTLFERVDIPEATEQETSSILVGLVVQNLTNNKIAAHYNAVLEIVQKSNRLMMDRKQPEKSIVLLNDCFAEAAARKMEAVTVTLVDELVSQKTKTPIGQINKSEADKLKNLEIILHKRIVGQNEAIEAIAKAMRRSRAEITTGNRPIGSFLFLGPTGVGKTETAKALAQAYFGQEDRMVRFDMTEFQGADGIKRLIGDIDSQTPGILTTKIRENPYTLLLLDEFEKAAAGIHNLLLQVLDEGFLTDAFGKKVSFDNVIIIATSNAGAEFIREQLESPVKQGQTLSKQLVDFILEKGLFTPELINRFDGVIVYHPLTMDQAFAVTKLMLQNLAVSIKQSKNIQLEITDELAQKVAQKGFDPALGARPIRRFIADKLEDAIAKMIIGQLVKNGQTITADMLIRFV